MVISKAPCRSAWCLERWIKLAWLKLACLHDKALFEFWAKLLITGQLVPWVCYESYQIFVLQQHCALVNKFGLIWFDLLVCLTCFLIWHSMAIQKSNRYKYCTNTAMWRIFVAAISTNIHIHNHVMLSYSLSYQTSSCIAVYLYLKSLTAF